MRGIPLSYAYLWGFLFWLRCREHFWHLCMPRKIKCEGIVLILWVMYCLPWEGEISPLRVGESLGCRSVTQFLPRMYKALSSNPSTRNKNKQTSELHCPWLSRKHFWHVLWAAATKPSALAFISPSKCYSQATALRDKWSPWKHLFHSSW